MGPNFPLRNESTNEMIYEMNHILNCGYEIKWSFDPRSYGHIRSSVSFIISFAKIALQFSI